MTQAESSAADAERPSHQPRTPSGMVARLHPLLRIALPSLAVLSVLYACYMLVLVVPASHDELHFAHAVWLMQHGSQPFEGFVFHNSPLTLYVLRFYGLFDPQFGPEILYWGRALVAGALVASAYYLFKIGKLIATPAVGWLMVLLFTPTTTVVYTRTLLIKNNFQIRPEVYAYPFILASLYFALLLLKKPAPGEPPADKPWLLALRSAVAAGMALCFTPRVIFFVLGVIVVLLINARRLPWKIWLGVAVGAAVPLVFYLGVVGFEDSYTWVYQYTKVLHSASEYSRHYWLIRNPALPLLLLALPCAVAILFLGTNAMQKALGGVTLVMFANVLVEDHLSSSSWNVNLVFGAMLGALAIRWLWRRQHILPMGVAVLMALACLAFPLRREMHCLRLHTHREYQLRGQIAAYQELCAALAGDSIMHIQKYHPIAVDDSMYYFWTHRGHAVRLAEDLPLEQQVDSFLTMVQEYPPALLAPEELDDMIRTDEERARIDAFLAANYRETEAGEYHYFIRNDRYDDLQPLLDSPELYVHMWPVAKP